MNLSANSEQRTANSELRTRVRGLSVANHCAVALRMAQWPGRTNAFSFAVAILLEAQEANMLAALLPEPVSLEREFEEVWWAGVRKGKYPKGIKLGSKTTVWRAEDICALIEQAG